MENNKQTTVEWFNQQLVDRQNGIGDSRSRDEIFNKALQMEKEQKIEFTKICIDHIFKPMDVSKSSIEQYHKQTYGK